MDRYCIKCRAKLIQSHTGYLCFPCQEKKMNAIARDAKPYYTAAELAEIRGTGEEQVRRAGRAGLIPGRIPGIKFHHYDRKTVDEWIRLGGVIQGSPTNPLQKEALALCQKGDHRWLQDERFNGQAFTSEPSYQRNGSLISAGYTRICYFCGYTEFIPIN